MKTFQEFIVEARKYTRTRSREDAEKLRQSKEDPSLYRLKNRQTTETPYWGLEPRAKHKVLYPYKLFLLHQILLLQAEYHNQQVLLYSK